MDKAGPYYFFEHNPFHGRGHGLKIALLMDFDGTLVPIQKDPALCILPEDVKEQLQTIKDSGYCFFAVISGRSLKDIRERIGIPGACYAGNHGLDISCGDIQYVHPAATAAKPAIEEAVRRLLKEVGHIRGVLLENKMFTLSLHYRLVSREQVRPVKDIFCRIAAECSDKGLLSVMKGKRVLELIPGVAWNKGSAALRILRGMDDTYLPVYMGDDRTDETAFQALGDQGITVRVGRSKNTSAHYYIKSWRDVPRFLKEVQRAIGCRY